MGGNNFRLSGFACLQSLGSCHLVSRSTSYLLLTTCCLHTCYLLVPELHFASSFPVSIAFAAGDITCNSQSGSASLLGGKTWQGEGKRGKRRNWLFFPACSRTDTAFCVQQQGEGNLERPMPIRHLNMQGK